MSKILRRTMGRGEFNAIIQVLNGALLRAGGSAKASAAIANGTTPGNLKTVVAVDYAIGGLVPAVQLAITDDLWDLSAETDTTATQFRSYWLYQDGTFLASPNVESAVDALNSLPAPDTAKSIVGAYVAGVSTDFDAAGGLAAQGTIHNGVPDGAGGAVDYIESVPA